MWMMSSRPSEQLSGNVTEFTTMKKPVVAQTNDIFFLDIQPFIYKYLLSLKGFHCVYFAQEFRDLPSHRMPRRDAYLVPVQAPRKYTARWLASGIRRRLTGRYLSPSEEILRRRKVKVIHAHFGPRGWEAIKLRGSLSIPIITSFYGYDVSRYALEAEWVKRYEELFREGSLFLVEGDFMKSRLVQLGAPEEKVKVQRIAVDLDELPFRVRRPKGSNEPVVLFFCGRFIEKKGLRYALEAIAIARRRHCNVEFRVVGDGVLRPQLEAFVRENGLEGFVRFLGEMSHAQYLQAMNDADIYVHHSITAADGNSEGGAPTTILEAQAMGLPVISTLHADIPNVVVPGKSALLSAERDCEAMADNIVRLCREPDRWQEMGRVGRSFIEQHHDIKREICTLEDHYLSVLS